MIRSKCAPCLATWPTVHWSHGSKRIPKRNATCRHRSRKGQTPSRQRSLSVCHSSGLAQRCRFALFSWQTNREWFDYGCLGWEKQANCEMPFETGWPGECYRLSVPLYAHDAAFARPRKAVPRSPSGSACHRTPKRSRPLIWFFVSLVCFVENPEPYFSWTSMHRTAGSGLAGFSGSVTETRPPSCLTASGLRSPSK